MTDNHTLNTFEAGRRSRWMTRLQVGLLGVAAVLAGFFAIVAVPQMSARAQSPAQGLPDGPPPPGGGFRGPFMGRGGPGMQEERKVLDQFDANRNKRLDADERKAAREWLASQPAGGAFGRRGGRGGPGFAPASEGPRLTPAEVKSYPDADLYDPGTLRTIFLQFEEADWEQALQDFHNTDVDVPATVVVDGRTYKDVGVRFRGMSSYFMVPAGSKRSLNLSFDFVHQKQDLKGYRTLNLLNENGDPTFVRGVIYSEIARAYIPAPKQNYVRVVINGESWGIYVNAQQFNKDFLRENYGTTKGARWKVSGSPGGRGGMEYLGDDPALYKRTYEIKTKDDPKAWADLVALFKILNETPVDQLEAALQPVLDVDGALKFLALDIAVANSDGFWTRASDYSIYQDEKGRFHVIPHDMNEALLDEGAGRGGRGFGGPPGPPPGAFPGGFRGRGPMFAGSFVELDPLFGLDDTAKPLRSRLLAVPSLRARYLGYVREIAERWLDWKILDPIVRQRQALIAADVKLDTKKLYSTEAFSADVSGSEDSLQSFVEKRRAFLLKGTSRRGEL